MLRVTRLHILLFLIGIGCFAFGTFRWLNQGRSAGDRAPETVQPVPAPTPEMQAAQAGDQLQQQARQAIATVGEAYRPLSRQYGEIAPIVRPLRAAKKFQAEKHPEEALLAARDAWQALKTFRVKVAAAAPDYQVVRGDTLWKIAQAHSPVHDGAGWVTIWKANQSQVHNFDRIEVGMTLTIPPQRTDYVMPFWKPR
jgi:nucleoid-associated protein YgaU